MQGDNTMNSWKLKNPHKEIEKITNFIQEYACNDEKIVVAVSGGLDSDVVARLCTRSVGKERMKFFIVIQSEMEKKFLENARSLAKELDVSLAEIHLEKMNEELMEALENGEKEKIFNTKMMLELAKAKCSVRSSVISSYQDKGFLIAGTTNRTEKELGFLLTFGDNLAHFKPVAHLYKTEIRKLAFALGTAQNVIEQEPSAGFWEGQTDKEDLGYWIINDGPIVFPREFSEKEISCAENIALLLEPEKVDTVLRMYREGRAVADILNETKFSENIVIGLIHIIEKSKLLKNRKIMVEIPVSEEN